MSELEQVLQHLKQPEYVHVLLNPLPVYAGIMGVLALALALLIRSKHAQVIGLILVAIANGAAWPVIEYGEQGYDRVQSMSNSEGQAWLKEHAARASRSEPVFYVTAGLAVLALAAAWKFPKAFTALAAIALAAAIVCVGIAGWISHAGGQVRHSEFRDGPPPNR